MGLPYTEKDFILHIKAAPGATDLDSSILQIMSDAHIERAIKARFVCVLTQEVYYHICVSGPTLLTLRERIDALIQYQIFDLFELRSW